MKALQYESATTSPKDTHKGKDRKRKKGQEREAQKKEKVQECEDLTNHRPCNKTWFLCSLGSRSGGRSRGELLNKCWGEVGRTHHPLGLYSFRFRGI